MLKFATLVATALLLPSASAEASSCVPLKRGRVTISGVLIERTYPGPPNFDDVRSGDRPETEYLVRLAAPACIELPADDPGGEKDRMREVQLVLTDDQYKSQQRQLNHAVTVSGEPFGAVTAHHRTPVLLDDVKFEH